MPDQSKDQLKDRVQGQTQTTVRRRRYAPAPSHAPLVSLTPVKVRMLSYLAELRFLSLPQLARLCCPSERRDLGEKSARRHLRALFDAGLVDVLPVSRVALAPPDAGNDASLLHGSAPNVYAPTAAALVTLRRLGLSDVEPPARTRPAYGPRNSLFLAHDLAVRDVRVWLEECAREHGHAVEHWVDGEAAAIPLDGPGALRLVRPDAWFAYRMGKVVLVGLVEADRGTERGARHWREKLARYVDLYESGGLRTATGYVNGRVLVVTPNTRRRDQLAALIGKYEGLAGRFWLAERNVLNQGALRGRHWRLPGDPSLRPLIGDIG